MSAEKLYTPEMLAAAVELAHFPPIENATLHGEARSVSCGSTLALDLMQDAKGRVEGIGLRVRACAVGQASAAIFGRHIAGMTGADLLEARSAMLLWLKEDGPLPSWPDIELIAAAKDYPGRHGAMLLPWNAAADALSRTAASS